MSAAILDELGLGHHRERFLAEKIDREALLACSDADLKSLGVAALGERKKLVAWIDAQKLLAPAVDEGEGQRAIPVGRGHPPRVTNGRRTLILSAAILGVAIAAGVALVIKSTSSSRIRITPTEDGWGGLRWNTPLRVALTEFKGSILRGSCLMGNRRVKECEGDKDCRDINDVESVSACWLEVSAQGRPATIYFRLEPAQGVAVFRNVSINLGGAEIFETERARLEKKLGTLNGYSAGSTDAACFSAAGRGMCTWYSEHISLVLSLSGGDRCAEGSCTWLEFHESPVIGTIPFDQVR